MSSTNRRTIQRKLIRHCCAAVVYECGAKEISSNCLALLTEVLDAFLSELAASARRYAELAGRNIPIPADVLAAVINIGMDLRLLIEFARHPKRIILNPAATDSMPDILVEPAFAPEPPKQRPNAIPDYLPPFPPPHTYVRTSPQSSPALSYQLVRERMASQRRCIERALVRLLSASVAQDSNEETAAHMPVLFTGDPHAFSVLPPRYDDQPWLRISRHVNEDSLAAIMSCGSDPVLARSSSLKSITDRS